MRRVGFPISAKITLLFLMLSILMIGAVSFIDFIYKFAEHSAIDKGDTKVYFK